MSFESAKLPSTQLKVMGKGKPEIIPKQFFIAHPPRQIGKVPFALQY